MTTMKKLIYSILFLSLLLVGCSNSDDDGKELARIYIDISDFSMYRGSSIGAVEVQFNTLKKKELVNKYLGRVYNSGEYQNYTIQFNGDKLRFVDSQDGRTGTQIISTYEYISDSLYIHVRDTIKGIDTLRFVALVDTNNNLYREKGLCRYPYPERGDTLRSLDQNLTLEKMLNLSGYNNLQEITDPKDTIVWCNVKYLFF